VELRLLYSGEGCRRRVPTTYNCYKELTLHCGRMLARRGPGAHGWPNVRAAARTRPDGKQAHAAHGSRDSWYSRRARLRKLRRHAGLRVAALRQSGRLHHPDMLAGPPDRWHVRLGPEGAECVPRGVSRWLYGRGGGRESPHRRTSGVLELGCNARSLARKLFPMPPSASAVAASSWAMTSGASGGRIAWSWPESGSGKDGGVGGVVGAAFSEGGGLVVSSASAARRFTSSASHASH
jgi:hypothetical protein